MRFLSLFSGIEAASVAWLPLGWQCAAVSEIEPFPCALLKHYYPDAPNLGDVRTITREQVEALGPIDVLIGGFPCQDLSLAGKRAGLRNDDGSATRSGLFFDAMRIAEWSMARFVLVENVPGIFSSNKGRDFAAVVGEMAGCRFDVPRDGWQNAGFVSGPRGMVEWCVLDAQFFGVPQKRRRVFIIRDSGDWASRPPIFLERESLSGSPPPRRKAGESVAGTLVARTKGGGGFGTDFECAGGLVPVAFDCKASGRNGFGVGEIASTLRSMGHANSHQNGGGHLAVMTAGGGGGGIACSIQANIINRQDHNGGNGLGFSEEVSPTLTKADRHAVAFKMSVRRLTPLECERLQGFRDDYSLITIRNKPAADGSRYKALGNSFAVPVVRWIGERIQAVAQFTDRAR